MIDKEKLKVEAVNKSRNITLKQFLIAMTLIFMCELLFVAAFKIYFNLIRCL